MDSTVRTARKCREFSAAYGAGTKVLQSQFHADGSRVQEYDPNLAPSEVGGEGPSLFDALYGAEFMGLESDVLSRAGFDHETSTDTVMQDKHMGVMLETLEEMGISYDE